MRSPFSEVPKYFLLVYGAIVPLLVLHGLYLLIPSQGMFTALGLIALLAGTTLVAWALVMRKRRDRAAKSRPSPTTDPIVKAVHSAEFSDRRYLDEIPAFSRASDRQRIRNTRSDGGDDDDSDNDAWRRYISRHNAITLILVITLIALWLAGFCPTGAQCAGILGR